MTQTTNPYDIAAARLLPGKLDAIREFWAHFEENADFLDEAFTSQDSEMVASSFKVMGQLSEIAPDLMWEFGPSEKGHAVCITPEWRNDLRPLARAVTNLAPDLPRWKIIGARTGNDDHEFATNFESRFHMPLTLSRIDVTQGADNKVQMIGLGTGDSESLGNQVLAVATYLLGEQIDWDWFGDVETQVLKTGGFLGFGKLPTPDPFDPMMFKSDFLAAIESIKSSLPDALYSTLDPDSRPMALLQIEEAREDIGRPDLITFTAPSESYAEAALLTNRFSSVNHSRFGEWFLFISIPRTPETPFDQVEDRADIEDALHDTLSFAGIGGTVAGAHGNEAVYIDLAVTDIDKALQLVADALSARPSFNDISVHFLEAGLPETAFPLSDFRQRSN